MTLTIICVVGLFGCSNEDSHNSYFGCSNEDSHNSYFGFSKDDFTVIEEKDTHEGFHGDGSYHLILDCSENTETALELVGTWDKLPFSETLDLVMFGGEKAGVSYEYSFSEDAQLPLIENGYYYFTDRHSAARDSLNDSELLNRRSFNFSLGVYEFILLL